MFYRLVCIPSQKLMLDYSAVIVSDSDDKFALTQTLCSYFNSDNHYLCFILDSVNNLHFLVLGHGWDHSLLAFLVEHYGFDLPF